MRIAFIAKFFLPGIGGGEEFMQNVLQYFALNGNECFAICFYDGSTMTPFSENKEFKLDGINIMQRNNFRDVDTIYKEISPDIVITQSSGSLFFLKKAKELGIRTIFGVHFYDDFIRPKNGAPFLNVLNTNSFNVNTGNFEIFKYADKIFVNSDFTFNFLKLYTEKEADEIIYPPINLEKTLSKQKKPKTFITLINPCIGKGLGVFTQLAKRLPNLKFMLVGNVVDKSEKNLNMFKIAKGLPNVKCIMQSESMKEVYEDTKILLTPSLVDETFSMVTLEAMANGIPIISSKHGNLPNLVQDKCGFCISENNLPMWENKVKELFEKPDLYSEISLNCIDEFKKYQPTDQLKKFKTLILSQKKINILGVFLHYYPPIGGAEISIHETLQKMSSFINENTKVYCYLNKDSSRFVQETSFKVDGVSVVQATTKTDLAAIMQNFDVVFTTLQASVSVVKAAKNFGKIVVNFVCDEICFKRKEILNAIKNSDIVVSNSLYVQKRLYDIGIKSILLHPLFNKETKQMDVKKQNILFINPSVHKGYEVIKVLIKKFPNEHFIIVGDIGKNDGISQKIEILKNSNVDYLCSIYNKKKLDYLYQTSKVTLVPSQVAETFSMVAAESIYRGIPVIASNIGALPQTIGECGILVNQYDNFFEWEKTLREFLQIGHNFDFDKQKKYFDQYLDVKVLTNAIVSKFM